MLAQQFFSSLKKIVKRFFYSPLLQNFFLSFVIGRRNLLVFVIRSLDFWMWSMCRGWAEWEEFGWIWNASRFFQRMTFGHAIFLDSKHNLFGLVRRKRTHVCSIRFSNVDCAQLVRYGENHIKTNLSYLSRTTTLSKKTF